MERMHGFREGSCPTIEALLRQEKQFEECFAEATVPTVLWLNKLRTGEDPQAFGSLKDLLQSQALPTLPELRRAHPSIWDDMCEQKVEFFRQLADKARTEEEKKELNIAVENRRIMSGVRPPSDRQQEALPKYFLTQAKGRDFCYRLENGVKILGVPEPESFAYRINIPDAPGELREVILSRVAQKLWMDPVLRRHGFQAKIIGFTKTDGLIFYFGNKAVDQGLKTIHADALQYRYGKGEAARFGQLVDPRLTGITITTNPKNERGETAGTFGDVVSELLATSLSVGLKKSQLKPEALIKALLDIEAQEWTADILEPIFNEEARKKFGRKLNLQNLAFIDKGSR